MVIQIWNAQMNEHHNKSNLKFASKNVIWLEKNRLFDFKMQNLFPINKMNENIKFDWNRMFTEYC